VEVEARRSETIEARRREMKKKKKKQAQELNEEQLETVSGGLNFAISPLEAKVDVADDSNGSPALLKACATGQHIKKAILNG
jgi:hypothetical protein